MVPRMSGISVANLLMDVMQFDWFEYAERDAQEAIEALHEKQPFVFNRDLLLKLKQILTPHIKAYAESMIVKKTVERGEVELFPPGKLCVSCTVFFCYDITPNNRIMGRNISQGIVFISIATAWVILGTLYPTLSFLRLMLAVVWSTIMYSKQGTNKRSWS